MGDLAYIGILDIVFGITNAYYMWLSSSNNFSTYLFQSDNIHISKMIVDKTVDKMCLRSSKMGCNEVLSLMANRSIAAKPSCDIGVYTYYRLYVI